MISDKNKVKIWVLSFSDVVVSFAYSIFVTQDFSIIDVLFSLPIIFSAYLVTQKQKRWSVWLWITLFAAPRIVNSALIFIEDGGLNYRLLLSFVVVLGICMISIRYFLQWSLSIWKKKKKQVSFAFWRSWIFIEELCIIFLSVFVMILIVSALGMQNALPGIVNALPVIGIVALYKKHIKPKCFQDLKITPLQAISAKKNTTNTI